MEFFPDEERLVARLPTTDLGLFLEAQRTWPLHERHVPGACMVQTTGILGQLYAVYLLGLRATDGWVGYGTHIKAARFPRLARIGPPVFCHAHVEQVRQIGQTTFTTFEFLFEQDSGEAVYESTQVAAWIRSDHRGLLNDGR